MGFVIVWRKRDREIRRRLNAGDDFAGGDLSQARLVAMDLHQRDFRGTNFSYADLTEADLTGADLREANLHGAYLTGAQLIGANLRGANLSEAYAIATDFGSAALQGADFTGIIFDQGTTWPGGFKPPFGKVGYWHGRRSTAEP